MAKVIDTPLKYDPSTGIFVWTKNVANKVKKGDIAGSLWKNGYVCIKYKNKIYKAHRLAFLFMTGSFPTNQVDHINRNRSDNRWDNLRDVTHLENMRNQKIRSTNTSGVTGVTFSGNRWKSTISVDGEQLYLGGFSKFSEAVNARKLAEVAYGYIGE